MGDIADMILEGILCDVCGMLFVDHNIPGHPRTCDDCQRQCFDCGEDLGTRSDDLRLCDECRPPSF
jgi:methionyl-tRNA synthetase